TQQNEVDQREVHAGSASPTVPAGWLSGSSRNSSSVMTLLGNAAAGWPLAARTQQWGKAFSASAFSEPELLLPARFSGVRVHRGVVLGGHGGCGAVRRSRLDRGRLDIDHATRPAEIVGPSARRRDSITRAQPNGRPRTFAGSSEQHLF